MIEIQKRTIDDMKVDYAEMMQNSSSGIYSHRLGSPKSSSILHSGHTCLSTIDLFRPIKKQTRPDTIIRADDCNLTPQENNYSNKSEAKTKKKKHSHRRTKRKSHIISIGEVCLTEPTPLDEPLTMSCHQMKKPVRLKSRRDTVSMH